MDIQSRFAGRYKKDASVDLIRAKVARRKSMSQKENRHKEFRKSRGLALVDINISSVKEHDLTVPEEEDEGKPVNKPASLANVKGKIAKERRTMLQRYKEEKELRRLKEQRENAKKGFKCGMYKPEIPSFLPSTCSVPVPKTKPNEKPAPPVAVSRITRATAKTAQVQVPQVPKSKAGSHAASRKNDKENKVIGIVPARTTRATATGRLPVTTTATSRLPATTTSKLPAAATSRLPATATATSRATAAAATSRLPATATATSRLPATATAASRLPTTVTAISQLPAPERAPLRTTAVVKPQKRPTKISPQLEKTVTMTESAVIDQVESVRLKPGLTFKEPSIDEACVTEETKPSFAPQNFVFQPLDGLSTFKFQPMTPNRANTFLCPTFAWSPMVGKNKFVSTRDPEVKVNQPSSPHELEVHPASPPSEPEMNPASPPLEPEMNPAFPPHEPAVHPASPPSEPEMNPASPHEPEVYPASPLEPEMNPASPPHELEVNSASPPHEFEMNPASPPHDFNVSPASPPHELEENPASPPHELEENPASPPHELEENPASPPHELEENPASPPHELEVSPASPYELEVNPASSPHELEVNPASSPHELEVNPASSPHELEVNPASSPHELEVNPASPPHEPEANPASHPHELEVNPAAPHETTPNTAADLEMDTSPAFETKGEAETVATVISPVCDKPMSPPASNAEMSQEALHDVPYFRGLLKSETQRLASLCTEWEKRFDVEIPEDSKDLIRTTVGQTRLLISERFKQFEGLVDNCEFKLGEKETTCTDLDGFWDMVSFQVEDVTRKFINLEKMEASSWQQTTVQAKKVTRKKTVPTAVNKSEATNARAAARNRLFAFKAAMRNKSRNQEEAMEDVAVSAPPLPVDTVVFDALFFRIESPAKLAGGLRRTPNASPGSNTPTSARKDLQNPDVLCVQDVKEAAEHENECRAQTPSTSPIRKALFSTEEESLQSDEPTPLVIHPESPQAEKVPPGIDLAKYLVPTEASLGSPAPTDTSIVEPTENVQEEVSTLESTDAVTDVVMSSPEKDPGIKGVRTHHPRDFHDDSFRRCSVFMVNRTPTNYVPSIATSDLIEFSPMEH
ncbi:disks large-associated protein 5-like isoform X2 [Hyperolius riggenbachi]|uniref:disks large-associated protein 5-like isoform X2 n=1 Tax=Hyperolius riggenbachi TaxID=752182 RepID=UPI0035A2B1EE